MLHFLERDDRKAAVQIARHIGFIDSEGHDLMIAIGSKEIGAPHRRRDRCRRAPAYSRAEFLVGGGTDLVLEPIVNALASFRRRPAHEILGIRRHAFHDAKIAAAHGAAAHPSMRQVQIEGRRAIFAARVGDYVEAVGDQPANRDIPR